MNTLSRLAERIWSNGESKRKGSCCLLPEGKDDFIISKYDATHYDISWHKRGKSVVVNLYCAYAFGAVLDEDLKLVHSEIVDVFGEEE